MQGWPEAACRSSYLRGPACRARTITPGELCTGESLRQACVAEAKNYADRGRCQSIHLRPMHVAHAWIYAECAWQQRFLRRRSVPQGGWKRVGKITRGPNARCISENACVGQMHPQTGAKKHSPNCALAIAGEPGNAQPQANLHMGFSCQRHFGP